MDVSWPEEDKVEAVIGSSSSWPESESESESGNVGGGIEEKAGKMRRG